MNSIVYRLSWHYGHNPDLNFDQIADGEFYIVYRLTRYYGHVYGKIFAYTSDYSAADLMFQCVADNFPDDDLFITKTDKSVEAFKLHPSFRRVTWL